MRIAIVQSTWTPHSQARIENLRDHSSDHEIVVVTVAASQSDYRWPDPSSDTDGVLFPDADYWQVSPVEIRRATGRRLSSLDPEVVVLPGWAFQESLGGMRWAAEADRPSVLVSDSHRDDTTRTWVKERLKRALISGFDSALVGGSRHVAYLETLGFDPERCFFGCDVVDNAHFSTGRSRSDGDAPTLLSCIRLLERKNVPFVLRVLADDRSGWRWNIAGDGPARGEIQQLIDELGLGTRVSLVGHVDYAELPALYASADAYLQPSISEPWGLAVNEAMAAGLPVLVSDRCGCTDDLVAEGENGWVFDPASAESLTERLASLAERRGQWKDMGAVSQRIIGGWDLDLYATNLVKAAEVARSDHKRSFTSRVIARVL